MARYQVNIEIMRCVDCGQLGVALADPPDGTIEHGSRRLTSHNCNDRWERVSVQSGIVDTDQVRRYSTAALRRMSGGMEWIKRQAKRTKVD
jgi:hypothetical protein